MTARTFWRASFALPLVCALLAFAILRSVGRVGEPSLLASQTLFTIAMSGYLLGIPYILFAVILLAVLWSRPVSVYRRVALIAPILFGFMLLAIVASYFLASHGQPLDAVDPKLRPFYVLELGLGYAYVGIVFAGAWLLERLRVFEQPGAVGEHSA